MTNVIIALFLDLLVQTAKPTVAVQVTAHNSQVGCDTIANFEDYNQVSHAKSFALLPPGCKVLHGGAHLIAVGEKQRARLAGNDIPVQRYQVDGQFSSPDKKEPLLLWLSPSYTESIPQ